MTDFEKVLRECARWNVRVHLGDPPARLVDCSLDRKLFAAPSSISHIERATRPAIWWCDICDAGNAPALLHELAHCIIGRCPCCVDEIDSGMLAVEHEAQRRLRLERWQAWMRDYGITGRDPDGGCTSYVDWGCASPREKALSLDLSRHAATAARLLDKNGAPTYRRCKEFITDHTALSEKSE